MFLSCGLGGKASALVQWLVVCWLGGMTLLVVPLARMESVETEALGRCLGQHGALVPPPPPPPLLLFPLVPLLLWLLGTVAVVVVAAVSEGGWWRW